MSKKVLSPQQFRKAYIGFDEEAFVLSKEQAKDMASLFEGTLEGYKTGGLVKGKVLRSDSDGVLIDIGYKSDGLIPGYEFSDHEIKKMLPGTELEVIIEELENAEGNVALSYEKAKAMKAWSNIMKLYDENKPVEGIVTHKVKGGLSVDIGVTAFLPGSQVDVQRVTDFDSFVGQTIVANIIKVNQKRGNVIISRRKYLNDQRAEVRKKVLDVLEAGQVIQGLVKNITNYGVFIDIGGVDGLLHITDMTWGRIAHPSELVKIGDTINVKVLSFDKVNEKISLGMKQLSGNPWEGIKPEIQIGAKLKGTISSIADYGMFVEIQQGVEGLVHISEISWTNRVTDLNKHYKVGEAIEVIVVSFDKDNRRMSLSIKQLEKNPWDAISEEFQIGHKIKGKVSNVTEFGIFIQLAPGIDGLVHISDFSWTEHIEHPSDRYKKGDEVEAVIIGINKQSKKVSLGIKQLTEDPWTDVEKRFPAGSIVEGECTKIANFGAFIKLDEGVEGLLHQEEGSDKSAEGLKVGDKAKFRVLKVSQEDRKVSLTTKLEEDTEKRNRRSSHSSSSDKSEKSERPDRSERSERPERSDRSAERPRKRENTRKSSSESSSSTSGIKAKSLLQIELEKHVARQQGSTTKNEENE